MNMPAPIELAAIGDELMDGRNLDTNTRRLGAVLADLGLVPARRHTAGDDLLTLVPLFREIAGRARACIVTGGLGPTSDDRTVEALARATGVGLVESPRARAALVDMLESRGRRVGKANLKQTIVPAGARVVANPVGTAPMVVHDAGRCRFYLLPGVPREMEVLTERFVVPDLTALFGPLTPWWYRTVRTFGLPESMVGERTADFERAFPDLRLGYLVKFPEVHVTIGLRAPTAEAAAAALDAGTAGLIERLGAAVFAADDASPAQVLVRRLTARGETVAVAESCTGGHIADLITDVPGASKVFAGGVVTYANDEKTNRLGVEPLLFRTVGAVSREVAVAMAEGVRRTTGTTYGLATTGIAGPDGGTPEKPVGTVHVAVATPDGLHHEQHHFPLERRRFKEYTTHAALHLLLRHIRR